MARTLKHPAYKDIYSHQIILCCNLPFNPHPSQAYRSMYQCLMKIAANLLKAGLSGIKVTSSANVLTPSVYNDFVNSINNKGFILVHIDKYKHCIHSHFPNSHFLVKVQLPQLKTLSTNPFTVKLQELHISALILQSVY